MVNELKKLHFHHYSLSFSPFDEASSFDTGSFLVLQILLFGPSELNSGFDVEVVELLHVGRECLPSFFHASEQRVHLFISKIRMSVPFSLFEDVCDLVIVYLTDKTDGLSLSMSYFVLFIQFFFVQTAEHFLLDFEQFLLLLSL